MSTSTKPDWLFKLEEIWSRKETAGFYEFKDLFEEQLAFQKKEIYQGLKSKIEQFETTLGGYPGLIKAVAWYRIKGFLKEI